MIFSQGDIIQVPAAETCSGWAYDHVQITSNLPDMDTARFWQTDAIPCRIEDTEIVHAPGFEVGEPTWTDAFITNVTQE